MFSPLCFLRLFLVCRSEKKENKKQTNVYLFSGTGQDPLPILLTVFTGLRSDHPSLFRCEVALVDPVRFAYITIVEGGRRRGGGGFWVDGDGCEAAEAFGAGEVDMDRRWLLLWL